MRFYPVIALTLSLGIAVAAIVFACLSPHDTLNTTPDLVGSANIVWHIRFLGTEDDNLLGDILDGTNDPITTPGNLPQPSPDSPEEETEEPITDPGTEGSPSGNDPPDIKSDWGPEEQPEPESWVPDIEAWKKAGEIR